MLPGDNTWTYSLLSGKIKDNRFWSEIIYNFKKAIDIAFFIYKYSIISGTIFSVINQLLLNNLLKYDRFILLKKIVFCDLLV